MPGVIRLWFWVGLLSLPLAGGFMLLIVWEKSNLNYQLASGDMLLLKIILLIWHLVDSLLLSW